MNSSIVISAGHGKHVTGAVGYLDEFKENCNVAKEVTELLSALGVVAYCFIDEVSKTQNENLHRIVKFHNAQTRDLDVSIHFNAYRTTSKPMGTECLFLSQSELAQKVATGIAGASGLPNRGPKKRTDLFFLNQTDEPAILIEVCFVDSESDAELYREYFDEICSTIAETIKDG